MRTLGVSLLMALLAVAGCRGPGPVRGNIPPAELMMHPGPGVDGPGPGVMQYQPAMPPVNATSQLAFLGPDGMKIRWDITAPGRFDSEPLIAPGRYNFPQGAIYRLKLANIPGRPAVELYPTIEVAVAMPRTEAFLAHCPIPIQFTEEDFDQVLSGNFVTKVLYLPNAENQELALAGVETLVSTRLDPGVDPIVEADRRGSILAIVRLGNKDLQIGNGGMGGGEVAQTGYNCPVGAGGPLPMAYVSGMTAPQYGMPSVGTPIGLPGPPYVPLGVPAGLQKHVIVNHTPVDLPEPTRRERIDVRQQPGYGYPEPANHIRIVERTTDNTSLFPGIDPSRIGARRAAVCTDGPCDNAQPAAGGAPAAGN